MCAQDTDFCRKLIFPVIGKTIDLSTPVVMGVLNITPDSFFDGGRYTREEAAVEKVRQMVEQGAAIVDVGAVSTRPGAEEISEDQELGRLIPMLKTLRAAFPETILSVDTHRSRVAEKAIGSGGDMINDISGGNLDKGMLPLVASLKIPYVLTHMQGTPRNMQDNPRYNNVAEEVAAFFRQKIERLNKLGFNNIILDPGFGFGKTVEHNYRLLASLSQFKTFGYPLLAGFSRKSMINRVLGTKPESALNGTTVANTIALLNGADILRVHDVKEATEAVKIVEIVKGQSSRSVFP